MADSKLALVKSYLAYRYMNEECACKSNPAECIKSMFKDVRMGISSVRSCLGCSIWIAAQRCAIEMISRERNILDKLRMLKPEEISTIIDLVLHLHFGSPVIKFSWPEVKTLQKLEINKNIAVNSIAEDSLPNSLWIEITGNPCTEIPSWIGRTAGILLTKIPLHASEKADVFSSLKVLPQWKHIVDMLGAFCKCNSRCIGYIATAAQSESSGYRFVSTIFGHEENETVEDMLLLHEEITQTRKFKEVERFTAKLCIKTIFCHTI